MKYFLDSNIIISTAISEGRKSEFKQCARLISLVKEGKIEAVTSNIILAEVSWTLKTYYKVLKPEVIKTLRAVSNLKIPFKDNFDSGKAITLFEKYPVKYIDCLIASVPEIYNKKWTVVSYDKDFDRLKVIRKEPQQIKA